MLVRISLVVLLVALPISEVKAQSALARRFAACRCDPSGKTKKPRFLLPVAGGLGFLPIAAAARDSQLPTLALPSQFVLALRLTGCSVDAHAPIWELCMYGINADLRGYAGGRYRDRTMFASQAELRVPLVDRLATNLFGGLGTVAPSLSAIALPDLLPSAGLGLQYLVPGPYRLNVGSDVAWGKNGAAFYLRLGDAF